MLTIPRWLKAARTIDVQLRLVASLLRPLKHNTTVTLHTGTSETFCRVLLLDRDQLHPGDTGWAQLRLEQPVPVVKDDYFIIRSSETTLGGGNVVGAQARRHRPERRLNYREAGNAAGGQQRRGAAGCSGSPWPAGYQNPGPTGQPIPGRDAELGPRL